LRKGKLMYGQLKAKARLSTNSTTFTSIINCSIGS
jgi:hypothetical protein